jgi:hypothetical protein
MGARPATPASNWPVRYGDAMAGSGHDSAQCRLRRIWLRRLLNENLRANAGIKQNSSSATVDFAKLLRGFSDYCPIGGKDQGLS